MFDQRTISKSNNLPGGVKTGGLRIPGIAVMIFIILLVITSLGVAVELMVGNHHRT
jgi:hypothetical protein